MKRFLFVFVVLTVLSCKQADYSKNILVLGDSNGAHEKGWVYHLQRKVSPDTLLNYCISGNTIGFDNLGRKTLNTLRNIDGILTELDSSGRKIDEVLILLGTNDCKVVFTDSLEKIPVNLQALIKSIKGFNYSLGNTPKITVISPPPYGSDSLLISKYKGGNDRVQKLIPKFQEVAEMEQVGFINIYNDLKPGFDTLATDGVHLTQTGYEKMVDLIYEGLIK